jgi:hypothetical protein
MTLGTSRGEKWCHLLYRAEREEGKLKKVYILQF